ncbi:hypothetical protein BKA69DRAFT_1041803 [Paraphysoderma sedebokerense]|nr:hypothetical protein BKA69DRAFT_1041803 [Paraphysoderma sedebokerense]
MTSSTLHCRLPSAAADDNIQPSIKKKRQHRRPKKTLISPTVISFNPSSHPIPADLIASLPRHLKALLPEWIVGLHQKERLPLESASSGLEDGKDNTGGTQHKLFRNDSTDAVEKAKSPQEWIQLTRKKFQIEYSLHSPPTRLLKELAHIFCEAKRPSLATTASHTTQPATSPSQLLPSLSTDSTDPIRNNLERLELSSHVAENNQNSKLSSHLSSPDPASLSQNYHMRHPFDGLPIDMNQLLVIKTFQPTEHDLVSWGKEVDMERDLCLERFVHFASILRSKLVERGYWADLTDPASGYPIYTPHPPASTSIYPDVHGAEILLSYDTLSTGCCKVLIHPRWASRVYPGTVFTDADADVVKEVMAESVTTETELENS